MAASTFYDCWCHFRCLLVIRKRVNKARVVNRRERLSANRSPASAVPPLGRSAEKFDHQQSHMTDQPLSRSENVVRSIQKNYQDCHAGKQEGREVILFVATPFGTHRVFCLFAYSGL